MSSHPKVLICHPGRQHSHQAAIALQKAGMLAGYWTGIPCIKEHISLLPQSFSRALIQHSFFPFEKHLVHWLPIAPVLRKVTTICLPTFLSKDLIYLSHSLFDQYIARQLPSWKVEAVIGYEHSSLETFKTAKRLGITTILDASSIHYQAQDPFCLYKESLSVHRSINERKKQEIENADYILTVSELARQTYIEAGVSPDRIYVCCLGVNIDLFKPGKRVQRKGAPLTFLFVGSSSRLKGIDILIGAFNKINNSGNRICLRLISSKGDMQHLVDHTPKDSVCVKKRMKQDQLVKEYQNADCFVLPSRFDSFGMVVTEALACGLPVITSDQVGAKELIIEGENGWVVPKGDIEALAERMEWCFKNEDVLYSMREKARLSVLEASWSNYHDRLISVMKTILNSTAQHSV